MCCYDLPEVGKLGIDLSEVVKLGRDYLCTRNDTGGKGFRARHAFWICDHWLLFRSC